MLTPLKIALLLSAPFCRRISLPPLPPACAAHMSRSPATTPSAAASQRADFAAILRARYASASFDNRQPRLLHSMPQPEQRRNRHRQAARRCRHMFRLRRAFICCIPRRFMPFAITLPIFRFRFDAASAAADAATRPSPTRRIRQPSSTPPPAATHHVRHAALHCCRRPRLPPCRRRQCAATLRIFPPRTSMIPPAFRRASSATPIDYAAHFSHAAAVSQPLQPAGPCRDKRLRRPSCREGCQLLRPASVAQLPPFIRRQRRAFH